MNDLISYQENGWISISIFRQNPFKMAFSVTFYNVVVCIFMLSIPEYFSSPVFPSTTTLRHDLETNEIPGTRGDNGVIAYLVKIPIMYSSPDSGHEGYEEREHYQGNFYEV